jgi:ABC-type multidrug transport system fused ATPase/permease subunit
MPIFISSSVHDLRIQVAQESLGALRTVQAYNALKQEQEKFSAKAQHVFSLARREAVASGIFFGSTGWSGNVTLLALLAYGLWNPIHSLCIPRILTDINMKAVPSSAEVQFRSETSLVCCSIPLMWAVVCKH